MINKLSIYFLLFIFSIELMAQPTVTVGTTSYPINPELLGLNGRSTEGPSWTDNTFLSLVNDMNPTWVRYPAGTQGNQWNWKTGTFIASLNMNAREIFTIPMFVNGLPQNAKIIYMVNMVLPTEQTGISFSTTTDSQLATDATLTAKVTDILNALKAFENAGRLPEVCELGNELYFTNVHAGVYAGNPGFYLQHAKIIALAIKNKYPAMKIILCTTKGGTSSRDNWNNTVFNALSTDAQLGAVVYGVVQHHYINESYGNLSAVTNNTIAKTLIDEGIDYVKEIATDYAVVPSGKKLWVTEYGATKPTADGMWVAGMRYATMTLSFMKMGPKVDNLLWHHITDDPNVLNTTKNKLGPAGVAYMQLSKAMNGCNSYKKLVFSNMSATNDYAGLSGYKFFGNGLENILILNTENTSYTNLNLSALLSGETPDYARQYWSVTPYMTDVSTINNLSVNSSVTLNAYQINPFSITVFTRKPVTTINDVNETDVAIYPVIFHSDFTINSTENANCKMFDVSGKNVRSFSVGIGRNQVLTDDLAPGIYFISLNNSMFRLIKK